MQNNIDSNDLTKSIWPDDFDILPPFLFNPLKHHLSAIRAFILFSIKHKSNLHQVSLDLKLLGNSQMDIYDGFLTVSDIHKQLEDFLDLFLYKPENFDKWLTSAEGGFQEVSFSDTSRFTLLRGNRANRHIHIHPSRGSCHSFRAKAQPLRTAMLTHIAYGQGAIKEISTDTINSLRKMHLGLSPVKVIEHKGAIATLLKKTTPVVNLLN